MPEISLVDCDEWGRSIDTWPPENPTATTPSSAGLERNFWRIVDGDVMSRIIQCFAKDLKSGRRTLAGDDGPDENMATTLNHRISKD